MPFAIAGNIHLIDKSSLRRFERKLGIILSPHQPLLQQKRIIQQGIQTLGGIQNMLENLTRGELLSLIFIITQFGDVCLFEIPCEYSDLRNIPYLIEWKENHFMIPLEIFEFLSHERLFREQNYLFALIPTLSKDEKKSWLRWIEKDFDPDTNRLIDFEIYSQCRILQKPYNGKSLIQESEFQITDIWPTGACEEIDWFYKGFTNFYYSLQQLAGREKDPFKKHILDMIRCGKFIIKKPEKHMPPTKFLLVATVEGATPQLRESIFQWEIEMSRSPSLFQF